MHRSIVPFALTASLLGGRVFAQQIDPDGDDDPAEQGTGSLPSEMHFERVGRAPAALRRVCDLTAFAGSLYGAHANTPLGSDGASISRYTPGLSNPFTLAFDWNRRGQPSAGGGAGQGFLRVHTVGGRLFVPDADPPHNGFGISEGGTEGFVFISDVLGNFAPARGATLRPPAAPDALGRSGAAVLPRAYHVLDAIRFRANYYASTGSVPPRSHAWTGPSPGALHLANASLARWTYALDYPHPWLPGVWRLGFMVRYRDRLYAGIQDYDGREPNDYVVLRPPSSRSTVEQGDSSAVRVSPHGGVLTLRWYASEGRLYWLGYHRDDGLMLRVSDDGDHWRSIPMAPGAGAPTDIVRFRGSLVVLCERGLYRLDGDTVSRLASVPVDARGQSPFAFTDVFCAAPLGVLNNTLYAGGQRDGALWRIQDGPAPATPVAPLRRAHRA